MLQFSPRQWAVFREARTADFVARAQQQLQAVEPLRFLRLDGNAQRAEIRKGIDQARGLGLISEHAVMMFLEVNCHFAARPDLRARYGEWAGNLFSCGGCDPERTMAYLHQVISDHVASHPGAVATVGGEHA